MSAAPRMPAIFFGMQAGEHQPLIGYETLGKDAALAAPTPDHYLPLLYVLGAQQPGTMFRFQWKASTGGLSRCYPCAWDDAKSSPIKKDSPISRDIGLSVQVPGGVTPS